MRPFRYLIPAVFFLLGSSLDAFAAPPIHPGWPSSAGINTETPIAADLDGDGEMEILWGQLGRLNVRHHDGTYVGGWPYSYNPSGPPSVAELDGAPIVGMYSNDFNTRQGQVSLWRANGTPLPGWPKAIITGNQWVPHKLPLVLADIDGDGRPEVIYVSSTASDGTGTAVLHVDRIDGTALPGWPITLPLSGEDIYDGSPAIADVDGDGRLDIAIVTFHGKIFLYHENGVLFPGWPITQGSGNLIGNSVSFADVNGDGKLELIVATYDDRMGVYDSTGHALTGWPRTLNGTPYPPAFADFDNDGKLEIAFGTLGGGVYVLRADGTNFPGWPKIFSGTRVHSVALADLNSDGKVDLLATDGARNIYAWDSAGNALTALGFPFQIGGSFGFYSAPIVADIDRDGLIEIFALGDTNIYVWDLPTSFNPHLARYPVFMGGNAHMSRYAPEPTIDLAQKPVSASGNATQFSVSGTGFLKGMRAFIGDREQLVSNVTATTLTVTANNLPAPSGLYPLTVSNVNSGPSEPLIDAVSVSTSESPTPTPSATPTPRPAVTAYTQMPGRSGGASSDGGAVTVADDFQLAADTAITRVRWWGGYFNPPPVPDSFTLRLFADEGGHPGALITTLDVSRISKARTGFNSGSEPEFEYAADLRKPFPAKAGVKYWLSIVNPPDSVWLWEGSQNHNVAGSSRSVSDPVSGPWQPFNDDLAFQLESISGGLANISTRAHVGTGDDALIAGFIVTGSDRTRVLIRAIGPSLSASGIAGRLENPTLALHDSSGPIAYNNDWKLTQLGDVIHANQVAEIQATGAAPTDDRESALIATLEPNSNYTAVIHGIAGATGIALAEVYDLNYGSVARLANISTRSLVQSGDDVMISGFIIRNPSGRIIIRALGPSLIPLGIANALPDPFLELRDASGTLLASNDSWRSEQETEIIETKVPPTQDLEAAIVAHLPAGAYTGIIRDANGATGVGLIEVYDLDP